MTATFWSADQLLAADFPPPTFIVSEILPEGFTLFPGKPKIGKSWAALGMSIAVAAGIPAFGCLDVTAGPVLYLALEDTPRRLKSRLEILLDGRPAPPNLYLATKWPKGRPGAERIQKWAKVVTDPRLVVVDTLEKIRAPRVHNGGGNAYTDDYDAISILKEQADEFGMAIQALTHEAKRGADDMIEAATGSMGQAGTADQVWVMRRKRGEKTARIFLTGRELEDTTVSLDLGDSIGAWRVTGIDTGHEEWERKTEDKLVKFTMDPVEVLTGWCERVLPANEIDLRLPERRELAGLAQLSRAELSRAMEALLDTGVLVSRQEGRAKVTYYHRNGNSA